MAQVLLVRHAQGASLDGLTPLGWEQGRQLGASLASRGVNPQLLVHCGGAGDSETAEAACEAARWVAEVFVDPAWQEFDKHAVLDRHPPPFGERRPTRGEFQSWLEDATVRWSSGEHDEDYREPFARFAARIDAAVERVTERIGEDGTAIVFTAAGPVAWVVASLLADSRDGLACRTVWNRLGGVVVNASVTKLSIGRRGRSLVTFNDHGHLEVVPLA